MADEIQFAEQVREVFRRDGRHEAAADLGLTEISQIIVSYSGHCQTASSPPICPVGPACPNSRNARHPPLARLFLDLYKPPEA